MTHEELYSKDGIYDDFTYGSIFISRGFIYSLILAKDIKMLMKGKVKILVVGSGNGYELVHFLNEGFDATGLEIYIPEIKIVKDHTVRRSATNMPFPDKSFEYVFCTEMMEHLPEESIEPIFNEVRRVSNRFFFSIATRHDKPYDTHINIKPGWWWIKKIGQDMGFTLTEAVVNPNPVLIISNRFMQKAYYPDGVTLHGIC